ncbi:MAG: nucleoside triphosphate pyrophosphohydrolase [Firmicutes bacterium]|nr:nucleoside triphosphate pyrophosphohydrolase [Bacillota bacterium]
MALVDTMARLRGEDGCPWDREQTPRSLRPYLLEESYEVLEALEDGNRHKVCEELGDLLLQIVFHARLAEEEGRFTIEDVVRGINEKLIRRHPHVFGEVKAENSAEVLRNWEEIKRREREDRSGNSPAVEAQSGRRSILEGLPRNQPALMQAGWVQGKASRVGFDWENPEGAWDKVLEELRELEQARGDHREEELGDLLFAVVNFARLQGLEPEVALLGTVQKFVRRFRFIEEAAAASGRTPEDMTISEMDRIWEQAKREENRSSRPNSRSCKEEKVLE